jgi:hypothetical protein
MQEGQEYRTSDDTPPGHAPDAEPGSSGGGGSGDAPQLTAQAGAMDPDHPLLERAQRLLKTQLESRRAALQGELKEKRTGLKVGIQGWVLAAWAVPTGTDGVLTIAAAAAAAASATTLQRAQQQREALGVELYGFQQTLAKLQLALAKAREGLAETSDARCRWRAHAACAAAHVVLLSNHGIAVTGMRPAF